jgi:hypothetical protein
MTMKFWRNKTAAPNQPQTLRCSFCNKPQDKVAKLIAGPSVFICGECVQVCNHIIADDERFSSRLAAEPSERTHPETQSPPQPTRPVPTMTLYCSLCGLPILLEEALGVPERGFLCPACTNEIEAALADRNLKPEA